VHRSESLGLEAAGTAEGTRSTIGTSLHSSRNSLNFLRLVLALLVILSHSVAFGLWGSWEVFNGTSLGTIAVAGFFGISGYLIAGSALRNRPGRYLWQRFLRIFPGFWACLVVTAFGFGLLAWVTTPHACGTLGCYVDSPNGPFGYIYRNWFLQMNQASIAGLPRGKYDPYIWGEWNGSLWTLLYEFACYLVLMALAVLGILGRRAVVLGLTTMLFAAMLVITLVPNYSAHFNLLENWFLMNFMRLASVFLVGTLIYLYRDVVPDSGWLAAIAAALFVGSLWLPNGGHQPRLSFTLSSLCAGLIAYPLLWLGSHLPFQRIGARNDYSYGYYIYAYPVQQLLAMWGLIRWGYAGYTAAVIIVTTPLAVGSWWLIERNALRLKKLRADPTSRPAIDGVAGGAPGELGGLSLTDGHPPTGARG
jgi:peptidoglycan/LPS O-acetylase OafA/YrhL